MDHTLIPTLSLFAGVRRRRRLELARLFDEVTVPAGTVLTREGARADEFFVIVDGEAAVAVRGTPVESTLGPGAFLGEIGLLARSPRSATVVARTPMRVLVTAPPQFSALIGSFPPIGRRIRRTAAARLSGREVAVADD